MFIYHYPKPLRSWPWTTLKVLTTPNKRPSPLSIMLYKQAHSPSPQQRFIFSSHLRNDVLEHDFNTKAKEWAVWIFMNPIFRISVFSACFKKQSLFWRNCNSQLEALCLIYSAILSPDSLKSSLHRLNFQNGVSTKIDGPLRKVPPQPADPTTQNSAQNPSPASLFYWRFKKEEPLRLLFRDFFRRLRRVLNEWGREANMSDGDGKSIRGRASSSRSQRLFKHSKTLLYDDACILLRKSQELPLSFQMITFYWMKFYWMTTCIMISYLKLHDMGEAFWISACK